MSSKPAKERKRERKEEKEKEKGKKKSIWYGGSGLPLRGERKGIRRPCGIITLCYTPCSRLTRLHETLYLLKDCFPKEQRMTQWLRVLYCSCRVPGFGFQDPQGG